MCFVPLGGATPLIGVSAAASAAHAASSLIMTSSWEVAVVAPTAAARRAAGFHLARHSAVAMGKDHRVLFGIAMPNFRIATPSFQWAGVSAMSCSVPLYEAVVGVGCALHSAQSSYGAVGYTQVRGGHSPGRPSDAG